MMKRWLLFLLLFALLLVFAGCQTEASSMYIQPAVLTEGEKGIVQLLGADQQAAIYDFVLDKSVQSMQLCAYELIDGAWQPLQDGWLEMKDEKGRIALSYDRIPEYLRIAMQSEHHHSATSFSSEPEEEASTSMATSRMSEKTTIAYDQELPLVVQYMTSQNALASYNVDYFNQPEKLAAQGYDHVYAITVCFSQKTVAELDQPQ